MIGLEVALNATRAQVEFALKAKRFDDFRPVLKNGVLARLRRMARENFDTKGGLSTPRPWHPLAPSTLRRKKGPQIMVESKRLKRSVIMQTSDSITKMTRDGLEFGTAVPYADYHQTPERYKVKLPKRQVIPDPIPAEVERDLALLLRNWLVEGRIR
jgi:phage gpG-like protein